MRARSLVLVLSLAAGAAGCATLGAPPLSCPNLGGAPWTEALTPHVRLRTDLPDGEARALAVEVERAVEEVEQVVRAELHADALPTEQLQLTVFRRGADMRALDPLAQGHYRRYGQLWQPQPAIEMAGKLDSNGRHVLRHELTHWILERYLPTVPPWLDEGLAELYSTLRRDGAQVVVGEWASELYRFGYQPNVHELFAAEQPLFAQQVGYYTEASALVHLLQSERRAYRERFLRFLGELHRGVRWDLAWRDVFPALDLDALERDLNGYRFITLRVDTRRVPLAEAPPAPIGPTVRPLRDGEVHLLWLELRSARGPGGLRRAAHDLAEAARTEDSIELALWRAKLLLLRQQRREATAVLRAALGLFPDEPRLLHAYLGLVDDWSAGEPLARVARSAEELWHAARMLNTLGRREEALALLRRAAQLAPHNGTVWIGLATVAHKLGADAEAREAALRSAALQPWWDAPLVLLRILDLQAKAAGLPEADLPRALEPSLFAQPRGVLLDGQMVRDDRTPLAGWLHVRSRDGWTAVRLDENGRFHVQVPPGQVSFCLLPDAPDLSAQRFSRRVKPSPRPVDLGVVHVRTRAPEPPTEI